MEIFNDQLKAKLLEFKRQTDQNVVAAKQEIGKLVLQAQAAESNNKMLLEQLAQITAKLQDADRERKAKDDSRSAARIIKERKEKQAADFKLYWRAKRVFGWFRKSIRVAKKVDEFQDGVQEKLVKKAWEALKRQHLVKMVMKRNDFQRKLRRLKTAMTGMKVYGARRKWLRNAAQKLMYNRWGYRTLLGLKQWHSHGWRKRKAIEIALGNYSKTMFRKIATAFSLLIKEHYLPPKVEHELTLKGFLGFFGDETWWEQKIHRRKAGTQNGPKP